MRENIWKDGVMGLVIGDALGNPVQFTPRSVIKKHGLVTGMEECEVYRTPIGTWTDDSSMTLATVDSIIADGGINLHSIMSRFVKWYYQGEYTPFGKAFDQGSTCARAITTYAVKHNYLTCGRTDEWANGNGGLMRILPACLYCIKHDLPDEIAIDDIHDVTALTHNHPRALIGSGIYYFMAKNIITGSGGLATRLQRSIEQAFDYYFDHFKEHDTELAHYSRLLPIDKFMQIEEKDIRSSGYVVDTLEAAVWSLVNTSSFRDALLMAVNLGDDADTVGAVTGGLAGMYYGYDGIPGEWLDVLQKREWIETLCAEVSAV